MFIMLNFIEELYHRVLERMGVWLTKSTFLVAPQERVDLLLMALVD